MNARRLRNASGGAAALVAVLVAVAWAAGGPDEQERTVKEAEVPAAALKALKGLAGQAKITEFAEEIEHGHTYYEGSWKGPHGNVDALVTAEGDLVEIEEEVPLDMVPKTVMEKARKAAGSEAKLYVEKKTVLFYEVKDRRGDRRHEVIYSADGRSHEHENEKAGEDRDD